MISDSLWKLPESSNEHLGIIISTDVSTFPVHAVLCSHMGMGDVMGEAQRPAPDFFDEGTRLCFDCLTTFDPAIFTDDDPRVRYKGLLTPAQLEAVRADYALLYITGKIVGPGHLIG